MFLRRMVNLLSSCRWAGFLFVFSLVAPVRADEFYYVLVFASQQAPVRITPSHTFATFVKATGQGPYAENYQLEAHTISWLPQTLDLRPGALMPEPGQNIGLEATLRWALATGQHLSLWGPYQIDRVLYERAVRQIGFLESGQVQYKMIDTGFPAHRVSNCIHAVSAVAGSLPIQGLSPPGFGESASYHVVRRLERSIIDPCCKHEWVSARMGLRAYPIIDREWENQRCEVLFRPISSLLSQIHQP
jgi:hypothetical protein